MRNSWKSLTATFVLLAFSLGTVFGQTGHGYDRASLDPNTAACTDFYQYANGGWMAATPIPPAYSSWGVANLLDEVDALVVVGGRVYSGAVLQTGARLKLRDAWRASGRS